MGNYWTKVNEHFMPWQILTNSFRVAARAFLLGIELKGEESLPFLYPSANASAPPMGFKCLVEGKGTKQLPSGHESIPPWPPCQMPCSMPRTQSEHFLVPHFLANI
jgi:hypothetical protein